MSHIRKFAGLLALVATTVSCGDVVRQGRSPVYLVIDSLEGIRGSRSGASPSNVLLSDVVTVVTSPAPCSATSPCPTIFNDMGSVTLRVASKDVTLTTGPTLNNDVTIKRYRVAFRRSDGRNAPGMDVPYGFDGAVTGTVPAGGSASLGFELVRHTSKQESPLVQLVTSPVIISTIADITFFGQDQVGNELNVTGSITVDFGNFGDF